MNSPTEPGRNVATVSWDAPPTAVVPAWLVVSKASHAAVRVYAYLTLNIGRPTPTRAETMAALGISQKALQNAVAELEGLGALEHDGRHYTLHAEATELPPYTPAVLPALRHNDITKPPAIPRVDGRNQPLDALCRACDIQDGSPRIAQASAALYGRRGGKGITQLFWNDCYTKASTTNQLDALARLQAEPDVYAAALAAAIDHRAEMIKYKQPWRDSLSPQTIRELWTDILNMDAPGNGKRGLTPDEARLIT